MKVHRNKNTETEDEFASEQTTETTQDTINGTDEAEPIENEETLSKKDTSDITSLIKIKTLVLNYDPILKSQGNKYLHELFGWNNPRELAQDTLMISIAARERK